MSKRENHLSESSEDLLLTIPRLMHSLRPHGSLQLPDGSHLSIGQGRLLIWIECGHATVSELAEKSSVSLPTISRKIDLLVEKGLVSRRRDPQDRRTQVLAVTSAGRDTLEQLREHANRKVSQFLQELTDEELAQVRSSLKLLRKAFHFAENEKEL